MSQNLYVVCGGARTFLHCVDTLYENVISKLIGDQSEIQVLFYLKLIDPGPKNQSGWDFTYDPLKKEDVQAKIASLKTMYDHIITYEYILEEEVISPSELLSQVRDRSLYKDFFSKDEKLVRALYCHYNIEQCGLIIREMEERHGKGFDNYIYIRPDLYFTEESITLTQPIDSVILCNNPKVAHNNDHFAVIPKHKFDNFFFDRMTLVRSNTDTSFNCSEDIYWHTIKPYTVMPLCNYYIKRPE